MAPLARPNNAPLTAVRLLGEESAGAQVGGHSPALPGRGVGQPSEGSAEVLRGLGCGVGVLAQLRGVGLQVSEVAA